MSVDTLDHTGLELVSERLHLCVRCPVGHLVFDFVLTTKDTPLDSVLIIDAVVNDQVSKWDNKGDRPGIGWLHARRKSVPIGSVASICRCIPGSGREWCRSGRSIEPHICAYLPSIIIEVRYCLGWDAQEVSHLAIKTHVWLMSFVSINSWGESSAAVLLFARTHTSHWLYRDSDRYDLWSGRVTLDKCSN